MRQWNNIAGARLIAYHGAHSPERTPLRSEVGEYGPGFYFATERADAGIYGPVTYVAELDVQRPFVGGAELTPEMDRVRRAYRIDAEYLDEHEPMWPQIMGYIQTLIDTGMASRDSLQRIMTKLGYDAIVVPNEAIERKGITGDFVVVFDSAQIHSWTREAPMMRENGFRARSSPSAKLSREQRELMEHALWLWRARW